MPQKKKSTVKKTTKKRTTHKAKKGKVYIPAYKIIGFCAFIITICVGLLLITTLAAPKTSSITQRYEQPSPTKPSETTPAKQNETTTRENTSSSKKTDEPKPSKPVENPYLEKQDSQNQQKNTQQQNNTTSTTSKKIEEPQKTVQPSKTINNQTEKENKPSPAPSKPSYNFPKAKNGAQLIFVFDDGGQNNAQLEKYLTLPFPITVAVLPKLQNSASAAQKVRASGNEVILHQPMQAINASVNPGPGAIKPEMSDEEIKSVLFQNINEIGPIAGMNNHEGSAITADAEKMAVILQMASEEGIYFLDSRTNVDTKVPYVAGEMGYSYFERNIFLDNEKTKENALKELKKGLDIANKNGNVIMIGHVWSADFLPAFLNEVYPELKEKGYTFSVVSKSKARK